MEGLLSMTVFHCCCARLYLLCDPVKVNIWSVASCIHLHGQRTGAAVIDFNFSVEFPVYNPLYL